MGLARRSRTSSAPARGAAGISCSSSRRLRLLLAQVPSRLRAWAASLVPNHRRGRHLVGCVCRRRASVALLAPNHLGSRQVVCRHKVVCACHLRGWAALPLASQLGRHRPLVPNHIGRPRHRRPLLSQPHRPQQTSPRRAARPSRRYRRVGQEGHRPSRSSGSPPQTQVRIASSASANRRGPCRRGTLWPIRRSPARRLLPEARRRAVSLRRAQSLWETASRRGALALRRHPPKLPPSPPPRPQPLPSSPNQSTPPRTPGRRPSAHLRRCRRPQHPHSWLQSTRQNGQQTSRRRRRRLGQLRTPPNLPPRMQQPTRQRWRRRR